MGGVTEVSQIAITIHGSSCTIISKLIQWWINWELLQEWERWAREGGFHVYNIDFLLPNVTSFLLCYCTHVSFTIFEILFILISYFIYLILYSSIQVEIFKYSKRRKTLLSLHAICKLLWKTQVFNFKCVLIQSWHASTYLLQRSSACFFPPLQFHSNSLIYLYNPMYNFLKYWRCKAQITMKPGCNALTEVAVTLRVTFGQNICLATWD